MGFLDKVKNMFIEELEDEDVIKKEVIQVKIPKPEVSKEQKAEVKQPAKAEPAQVPKPAPRIYDDYIEEEEVIKPVAAPKPAPAEVKQPLPKYFDDSDFEMIDKPVEPTVVKQEYKYTRTETVVTPVISGYNGKKNEDTKKVFQPTPIISPVYGVLDKNYRKDEISSKKKPRTVYTDFDKISVDDIRKKAYGTLEDELEISLSSEHDTYMVTDEDLFNEEIIDNNEDNYEEQPIDIFGELEKNDALDDLLNQYDFKANNIYKDDDSSSSLVEDELNRNYDKYENELNKSYTKELNDSDLFNLIDSMYDKKDGE